MRQVKLIAPSSMENINKIKTAAYCRVSSNSLDQENSFANQVQTYTKLINNNPEWELIDIFADDGYTGTKSDNRPEFQRMIRMCELKQIDLILVKSISRFGRNVKETLEYTRKLKLLGIGIIFEKEGINTLSLSDEMLLNTFSAIAQEESQSISQNQRYSNKKRMEKGEYIATNAPYGYRLENKRLIIYEPEAIIIRYIFKAYLNGMSTVEIANDLNYKKIPTKTASALWQAATISYILKNERYSGDSLYQKTYREPNVPFKKHINRGEEDMFYVSSSHESIINKDTFNRANTLISSRKNKYGKCISKNIYPLTSRIRCSECGSYFRRKNKGGTIKWVCATHSCQSSACNSNYYSEVRIYNGLICMINKLRFSNLNIIETIIQKLTYISDEYKHTNIEAKLLSKDSYNLNSKLLLLNQLYSEQCLTPEVYQSQVKDIERQLTLLNQKRNESLKSPIIEMLKEIKRLQNFILKINEPLKEFDPEILSVIEHITINNKDEMTATFIGSLTFTETI